ncbi:MAG: hypothetical protein KDD70_11950, partial [Bdellovibrionales bacterium]|nr:hypothetical protein [Bdellovibrionales bacterium]
TLKSGISPSARVQLDLTITNNSGTQLDIDLFHLADFDLQPFISNDSATLANANDYIQVTTAGNENTAEYRAPGATAFLVRPFGSTDLGSVLSDALPTDFDNTGLPFGPGDFTGGFQFTRSIANGDSTTVSVILAVNETANSLVEACILPDLSCSVLSETDCTTATGVYFPDATCVDSDSDGRADIADNCPADPNKVDPDVCGCGVADTDTDSDGTLDCNDPCLADPNKVDPGVCGCGVADTDTDGDGVFICNDGCPDDANKAAPGVCGCGVADLDSDGDGSLDCNDECPLDAAKLAAGSCGCGVGDVDANSNGALDCLFNEELKARLNSALALLNSVKFPNNTKKLKAQRKIVSSLLVLSTDTTSYFETNANSFSLIESVANGGGISEPQSELGKAQKKLKRLRRKLTSEKKTFLRAKKAARKNLQKVIGQFA